MEKGSVSSAVVVFVVGIIVIVGFFLIKNVIIEKRDAIRREEIEKSGLTTQINVNIDGKSYIAVMENSRAAQSVIDALPLDTQMLDSNGNEKYAYVYQKLYSSPTFDRKINAGDIMLYGENRIVIFYKKTKTDKGYTRIGHIDNLDNISSGSVHVIFSK